MLNVYEGKGLSLESRLWVFGKSWVCIRTALYIPSLELGIVLWASYVKAGGVDKKNIKSMILLGRRAF